MRVKLAGELPKTTTWVEIARDGGLVVEHYDHSPDAEAAFGNDVAYFLRVAQPDVQAVLASLGVDTLQDRADRDRSLLDRIVEKFVGYYALKAWLDEQRVPYAKKFDPWA